MAEMRKCKECGKLFLPKGREQYCSDVHYRPCPICGEPVVATYLSDPPRRCANCRGKKGQPANTQKKIVKALIDVTAEMKQETPDKVSIDSAEWADSIKIESHETIDKDAFCELASGKVFIYIGNLHKNSFVPGHKYAVNVRRNGYVYTVSSEDDITSGDTVSHVQDYASQISFWQNFAELKEV